MPPRVAHPASVTSSRRLYDSGRTARSAILLLLVAGCASSSPSPPDTSAALPDDRAPGEPATGPDSSSADALAAEAPGETSGAEPTLDLDSLVSEIKAEARIEREASVLPFGIVWTPIAVEEGSAMAVRVLQPRGGREPVSISGTFAGAPVRFGPIGSSWLGMAAVPIGTSGVQQLELRMEFADGSSHVQTADVSAAARTWGRSTLRVAPRYSSPPPAVQDRIADDRRRIRAVLDHASPEWLIQGPFESPRPVDVTAEYGQERVFNDELQSRHTGLDLRGDVGNPVRAAGRGRVALAGDFYFSGNGVFVDHGLGVYTGYFHLSEILVTEGQVVERGELVGRVGATGRVTGPHLHWSLWVGGTGQDAGSLLEMNIPDR